MPIARLLSLYRFARSNRRRIVGALAADSKRSFWAMADQGVVSLGSFALNLLLARQFPMQGELNSLGSFGVLMGLGFFLRGVHAALVVYPLSVGGAVLEPARVGRLTTTALAGTLLGWPVMGALLVGAALVWQIGLVVGLWSAAAMLAWLIQETLRRGLMASLRFRQAVLGDCVAYLGPVGGVAWLAWRGPLALWMVFAALTAASMLAATIQAVQIGLARSGWLEFRAFAAESWRLGRWVLLGSGLSNFFTHTLFEWNLAWWLGKEALGVYYALSNLVRLANPVALAVASLVVPNAARVRRLEGLHRAKRLMQRFTLLGALALTPYLAMLLLLPHRAITLFFAADSTYLSHTLALRILALAAASSFCSICLASFLNAVERSRYTFIAQAASAVAFVGIAMPMTAMLGIVGAALGWLVAIGIEVAIEVWFIARLQDRPTMEPEGPGAAQVRSAPA
jgi:O-antigen/teichoic acid export membrane protein